MLADSYQQPLYVNCNQPMMQLQPQQLQYSPYQLPPMWSPYYHHQQQPTQPMSMAMTTPIGFSSALSPSSSGRFDAGYDSDASGSVAGMTPPQTTLPAMLPAMYQQHQHQHQHQHQQQACWRDSFVASFTNFPTGLWNLRVVSEPPDVGNTGLARNLWRYHRDQSARVRFACRNCGCSTKGTGQAVFWIYKDDAVNIGHIHLKLYGQKCPACKSPATDAVWQPQEAARAISGLFDHVAQSYYGMTPPAAVASQQEPAARSRKGSVTLTASTTTTADPDGQ